jgi:hypothetical protein
MAKPPSRFRNDPTLCQKCTQGDNCNDMLCVPRGGTCSPPSLGPSPCRASSLFSRPQLPRQRIAVRLATALEPVSSHLGASSPPPASAFAERWTASESPPCAVGLRPLRGDRRRRPWVTLRCRARQATSPAGTCEAGALHPERALSMQAHGEAVGRSPAKRVTTATE